MFNYFCEFFVQLMYKSTTHTTRRWNRPLGSFSIWLFQHMMNWFTTILWHPSLSWDRIITFHVLGTWFTSSNFPIPSRTCIQHFMKITIAVLNSEIVKVMKKKFHNLIMNLSPPNMVAKKLVGAKSVSWLCTQVNAHPIVWY